LTKDQKRLKRALKLTVKSFNSQETNQKSEDLNQLERAVDEQNRNKLKNANKDQETEMEEVQAGRKTETGHTNMTTDIQNISTATDLRTEDHIARTRNNRDTIQVETETSGQKKELKKRTEETRDGTTEAATEKCTKGGPREKKKI
jgi:hypothetical protein